MAVTTTGTPATYGGTNLENSPTMSTTVPAGATKLVVALCYKTGSASTTTSVQFGGVNLTSRASIGENDGLSWPVLELWTLDSPSVSTANVVPLLSQSNRITMVGFCVTGDVAGISGSSIATANAHSVSLSTPVNGLAITAQYVNDQDVVSIAVANSQIQVAQAATTTTGYNSLRLGAATKAGTGAPDTLSWTITGSPELNPMIVALALAAPPARLYDWLTGGHIKRPLAISQRT